MGLFHSELGLFTSGQTGLLYTQAVGTFSVFALTVVTITPCCVLLSYNGLLRVKYEEEARGLDYKFGNAASTCVSSELSRVGWPLSPLAAPRAAGTS